MAVQPFCQGVFVPRIVANHFATGVVWVFAVLVGGARSSTMLVVNSNLRTNVIGSASFDMRLENVVKLRLEAVVELVDVLDSVV